MKVSDNIHNLISNHKRRLDTYPDCIYLGQKENISLLAEKSKYGPVVDLYNRKIFGIDFFVLSVENHLNVSFVQK